MVGRSLVAIHDQTFLLGLAFCAGFGTGLLLGYLVYRSGLVPRRMALLGVIGGPPGLRHGDRRAVRRLRASLRDELRLHTPGNPLRGIARHLPHRQGVQAFSHPRFIIVPGRGARGRPGRVMATPGQTPNRQQLSRLDNSGSDCSTGTHGLPLRGMSGSRRRGAGRQSSRAFPWWATGRRVSHARPDSDEEAAPTTAEGHTPDHSGIARAGVPSPER
jgi:Domain of unknown function (DUF4386)